MPQQEEKKQKKKKKKKIRKPWRTRINFNICPECKGKVTYDEEHCLDYCTSCGLVTRASIEYVGVEKINYPYHILI